MDKKGFIQRMRIDKKSKTSIKRNIEYTGVFEKYLSNVKDRQMENAQPEDLEDFQLWGEQNKLKNLRMYFWSIATYFSYVEKKKMVLKAKEIMGSIELGKYRLNEFQGIDKKYVERLRRNKIKTARQLLEKGYTREERSRLAKTTSIPLEYILELIKLSDLARIPGVKKKRARLYYESGLDTLGKMAVCDAHELREISAKYIKKSGFDGVPPTAKEAEHTVARAKYLRKYVEY